MTPEKIEQAKKLRLEGNSPPEIAAILGVSKNSIYKYTSKLGVQPCHPLYKTHSIQHDFFSNKNILNNPSRLILVGFIAADGCVYRRTTTSQQTLVIRLSHKDSHVLQVFNDLISNGTRKISISKNSQAIDFPSNAICDDLALYGIIPRKTSVYTWPEGLTIEDTRLFLLGYFYGDGCSGTYNGRKILNFVSTTAFANSLKQFVINNNIADHCVVSLLKRNPNYAQSVFQGKHFERFAKWLFQTTPIPLLPRKHLI